MRERVRSRSFIFRAEKNGQLFIYSDPKGVEGDAWGRELRSRQGVKIEILNEDELRQLAPALSRIFKRAVYLPEQGQCKNPGKLVEALAAHAVRNGAKITRARVRDFEMGPDGPTALLTDTGRIPCERVVIAAGAWSGPLARKLGVGDSARNPGMVVTGLVLWIGDEGSFLALSLAGGGDPQAVPGIAHAMLFAYAILAAMLLKRRMRHGESIPEPE